MSQALRKSDAGNGWEGDEASSKFSTKFKSPQIKVVTSLAKEEIREMRRLLKVKSPDLKYRLKS